MHFLKKLYVGESVRHPEVTKWKIRLAAGQFHVHLIVISNNTDNQLEIFHNALLKQRYFRRQKMIVAGFAGSYDEAVDLIRRIAEDCVQTTGKADIKSFLLNQES